MKITKKRVIFAVTIFYLFNVAMKLMKNMSYIAPSDPAFMTPLAFVHAFLSVAFAFAVVGLPVIGCYMVIKGVKKRAK